MSFDILMPDFKFYRSLMSVKSQSLELEKTNFSFYTDPKNLILQNLSIKANIIVVGLFDKTDASTCLRIFNYLTKNCANTSLIIFGLDEIYQKYKKKFDASCLDFFYISLSSLALSLQTKGSGKIKLDQNLSKEPISFGVIQDQFLKMIILYQKQSISKESYDKFFSDLNLSQNFLGNSKQFQKIQNKVVQIAKNSKSRVLLIGLPGLGKLQTAVILHLMSGGSIKTFQIINLDEITNSDNLTALFENSYNHIFTNRSTNSNQKYAGSIYLRNVDKLDKTGQEKLVSLLNLHYKSLDKSLRKKFPFDLDVRFVSSSFENLALRVKEGYFHKELYQRLNVNQILMPSLFERGGDIVDIAENMLKDFCICANVSPKILSNDAKNWLLEQVWHNNFHGLRYFCQKLVTKFINNDILSIRDLESINNFIESSNYDTHQNDNTKIDTSRQEIKTIEIKTQETKTTDKVRIINLNQNYKSAKDQFDQLYLTEALKKSQNLKGEAAKVSGIDRTTFYRKMQTLKIKNKEQTKR